VTADPARLAAYDVVRAVRTQDAYANLVLPQAIRDHQLVGRDAGFATELAAGTLRRQGTYDAVIDACLDRGKVKPRIRDVLRLGTHQLLGMRVGSHAAVSTTVDLARARAGARSSGLVNAVLRKVSEHDLDTWVALVAPDPATDPIGHLVVAHSHPRWVVEELAGALGDRESELATLLAADNEAPGVVLVAWPGRSTRDELPGEPTTLSPYGVRLAGGDPGAVPAVAEGRAGVQDEGSQLVALALVAAPVDGDDARWLDLCAGPGGKAALLAALAHERGATLVANEPQEHRADLVRRALKGVEGVEVTSEDGRQPPWPAGLFDRVLVDAPCSGLGALRRRPEARWRKQPANIEQLVPLQRDLLVSALDLVRPGGVVVYATCSPVLAETAGVVDSVLATRDDVVVEPVALDLPDAEGPLAGTSQLWPHRHLSDAMFVAVLHRR